MQLGCFAKPLINGDDVNGYENGDENVTPLNENGNENDDDDDDENGDVNVIPLIESENDF